MNRVVHWSPAKVAALRDSMLAHPAHFTSRPLKHYFADHVYVRELFMRKGETVIGKVHLKSHVLIVLGDLHLYSQAGREHYEGVHAVECPLGFQRVLFAQDDTWIFTVHPNATNTRYVDELERVLVSADLALATRFAEGYLS